MNKTYASRYDEWADKIMQHVDVPDGLLGSSYHNDLCPSVMTKPIGKGDWYVQLFIDYPDPADREDSDSDRYTLVVMSDDGDHYHHTTDVYGCALTAVLGYRFALTIREWLTDGEWTEMCALYREDSAHANYPEKISRTDTTWATFNYAAEHCDDTKALLDAFTSIYGPLPDDRRIADEADVEMDKAYEFAVAHVFAAEEV